MGRRFTPLGLDEVEHAELKSLASRRSNLTAWFSHMNTPITSAVLKFSATNLGCLSIVTG